MYFVTRSKLAFMRNLLICNSDFRKKSRSNFAASRLALCGTGTALWLCRTRGWVIIDSSAVSIAASSRRRGRVHSLREGGYAALHNLLWWHYSDRTNFFIFCCICQPNFNLMYFLSRDAMLALYMPLWCIHLRGEDVILSDSTRLYWALLS